MTATVKPIDRLIEKAILLADLFTERTAREARKSKLNREEAVRIPCVGEMPKETRIPRLVHPYSNVTV